MSVNSHHPMYDMTFPDWVQMRDTYAGQRQVKGKNRDYLPATAGQTIDGLKAGQKGWDNYLCYKERAVFPGFVAQAVTAMIGIMHHKPANIEVPAALEPMIKDATVKGESLQILLRRINEAQLVFGRIGLLLDVEDGADVPYIATYDAEDIINWDDGARGELVKQSLNLVVLDESEFERQDGFEWKEEEKYRVLIIGDLDANEQESTYGVQVVDDGNSTVITENFISPNIRGQTLDEIPFIIINSKDIVPEPDDPPLLALSNLSLSVYRGEADYRQALHNQGQDTLVTIGLADDPTKPVRLGAGARIAIPTSDGDAKMIGSDSSGLPEMRTGIENDRQEAGEIGVRLLDTRGSDVASGEALRIRVSARTSTLVQIALSGAAGLEAILRIAATWVGANPDEVKVNPNIDFSDDQLEGRTLVDYATFKRMGGPLSWRSVHRILQDKDITTLTYEEELGEISDEIDPLLGTGAGSDADPALTPEQQASHQDAAQQNADANSTTAVGDGGA